MVILTINAMDPTRDFVLKWMEQRNYEFTVLWGDGYYQEVGVMAFPTTWVVDREGNIAFEVMGGTIHFAQEFGWRVEALLEG